MLDIIHHPPLHIRKMPPACVLLPQGTRKEHPDRHGERQTPVKPGEDLVSFLIFPWVSLILGEANKLSIFFAQQKMVKKKESATKSSLFWRNHPSQGHPKPYLSGSDSEPSQSCRDLLSCPGRSLVPEMSKLPQFTRNGAPMPQTIKSLKNKLQVWSLLKIHWHIYIICIYIYIHTIIWSIYI